MRCKESCQLSLLIYEIREEPTAEGFFPPKLCLLQVVRGKTALVVSGFTEKKSVFCRVGAGGIFFIIFVCFIIIIIRLVIHLALV